MLEDNKLEAEKKGQQKNFLLLSPKVHLRDKISNPLLRTLEALSGLHQIVTGKFSF
jgi:hypothetical protein